MGFIFCNENKVLNLKISSKYSQKWSPIFVKKLKSFFKIEDIPLCLSSQNEISKTKEPSLLIVNTYIQL